MIIEAKSKFAMYFQLQFILICQVLYKSIEEIFF